MRHWVAAIVLALFAVTGASAAAPAAAVDPALVGNWQTAVTTPAGTAQWFWDIHADGTYAFHSEGGPPAPSHSGIVTFNSGRWSLTATEGLPQWRDGGTYQMGNPNLLVATGVLGSGVWNRVADPDTQHIAFEYQRFGNQRVPENVPAIAKAVYASATRWNKDAVLYRIVATPSAADSEELGLEFQFYSPSKGSGLAAPLVDVANKGRELGPIKAPLGRIPPQFTDLLTAIAATAAQGNIGSIKQAELSVVQAATGVRTLLWQLTLDNADHPPAFNVEAIRSAFLENPVKNSAGQIDRDWAEANSSWQKFVTSQLPNPTRGPFGYVPPLTGQGCITPPACAALKAGDAAAATRIDGGYPTAQDIQKYDQ